MALNFPTSSRVLPMLELGRKRARLARAMIPVALAGGIGIDYWARRSIPS